MKQVRTFHGHDMPFVEVLVIDPDSGDGHWYLGDLRAWRQHDDGRWTAQVTWSKAPGERYMDVFEADQVRPYEGEPDGRG